MDKASDYESGDSRFESWQGRHLIFAFSFFSGFIFSLLLLNKKTGNTQNVSFNFSVLAVFIASACPRPTSHTRKPFGTH